MRKTMLKYLIVLTLFTMTGCSQKSDLEIQRVNPVTTTTSTLNSETNSKTNSKTSSWEIYNNKKYGFTFSYNATAIKLDISDSDDGLLSLNFISPLGNDNADKNLNGGLKIFYDIPSVAYSQNSLEESLKSAPRGMYSDFIGFSDGYKWKCGEGHNRGGDKTRDCQLQHGKDVFEFDYNYEFSKFLSVDDFNLIVKSFKFNN